MKISGWLKTAGLVMLVLGSGCSKREVPPPPKTQPELLLEIFDAARKQQYNATLLKLEKMRALDQTSVFLAELENTVRFNRLTSLVNAYLQMGRFDEALSALQDFETKYGYNDSTTKTKEQLILLSNLDRQIRLVKQAKRSDQLENEITKLKKLAKDIELSPKIANFLRKRESMIPDLRKLEAELMNREILTEAEEFFRSGDHRSGALLAAVYTINKPGQEERILSLLSGADTNNQSK